MNLCDDCPVRLFNTKCYNLQGVGNPYFGKCIVVPDVDYNAYKKRSMEYSEYVSIIKDVLFPMGEQDNLYILPFIRCNTNVSCEITDDIYKRDVTYLAKDIVKYDFRNILFLGDAAKVFFKCDITENLNNVLISKNRRYYNVNYSPFVKHIDSDKFVTFKTYLRKWITGDFTLYNKIML